MFLSGSIKETILAEGGHYAKSKKAAVNFCATISTYRPPIIEGGIILHQIGKIPDGAAPSYLD